jgi:hypothetical protein
MATIDVKDAGGSTTTIEKPLAPGRSAASTSRPVALSTEDKTALDLVHTDLAAEAILVGAVTETAPASDTSSSGLNGRLQRIAQRLSSLISLLPGSLGSKTSANSLAVVVASDQSALSVAGNYTAASGNFTRPANTTAYSSGQIIANNTTAGSCSPITLTVARANNTTGAIRRVSLKVNDSAWLNATVRVHLFQDSPTYSAGDGGTLTGNLTESGYLGYCDVTIDRSFASTTVKGRGVPDVGAEINFTPSSGTQNIFAVLEARSAVTPAASKVFTVTAEAMQN